MSIWIIWVFPNIWRCPIHGGYPICSMYRIFTNIGPKNHPNAGKYTIHGAYGYPQNHPFFGSMKSTTGRIPCRATWRRTWFSGPTSNLVLRSCIHTAGRYQQPSHGAVGIPICKSQNHLENFVIWGMVSSIFLTFLYISKVWSLYFVFVVVYIQSHPNHCCPCSGRL